MKSTIAAFAIAMLLVACQQQKNTASTSAPTSKSSTPAVASMTPEQLGELGAQIKKDPSHAHDLLSSHGLDDESFEKAIRSITQDPVASKRYAAAYKRASA